VHPHAPADGDVDRGGEGENIDNNEYGTGPAQLSSTRESPFEANSGAGLSVDRACHRL